MANAESPRGEACATALHDAGFDVVGTQGQDVLALSPAVIVVHVDNLQNDLALCRRLRSDNATKDVPVVVVTAADDANTREQIVRSGATSILVEPLRRTLLIRHIRRLLQRVRAHRYAVN